MRPFIEYFSQAWNDSATDRLCNDVPMHPSLPIDVLPDIEGLQDRWAVARKAQNVPDTGRFWLATGEVLTRGAYVDLHMVGVMAAP
jgi:hypothetical protein